VNRAAPQSQRNTVRWCQPETNCAQEDSKNAEKRQLLAEMSDKPKEKSKGSAQKKARDYRKIESGVFAAVDDVAREFSQAEGEFATQKEKAADEDEEGAEEEKGAAEFAERIHKDIIEERPRRRARVKT
jgi:hypothetical protein